MSNKNLHKAKKKKNNEFFTRLEDIEKELEHYKKFFGNKVVLCNCNDSLKSNFWKYFHINFGKLCLKKLIAISYNPTGIASKFEYYGGKDNNITYCVKSSLSSVGSFNDYECLEILKQADVVVTNPPFSLFREYVSQLIKYNKKFIIIGNKNAINYKKFFPLLKDNKVWVGNNPVKQFLDPYGNTIKFGNIGWYTNLDIKRRHEKLTLLKKYAKDKYPEYDNYNAINVDKVEDIPADYKGIMGVPITFLDRYNPEQFELIGHEHDLSGNLGVGVKEGQFMVDGKGKYKRILIKYKDKVGFNEK